MISCRHRHASKHSPKGGRTLPTHHRPALIRTTNNVFPPDLFQQFPDRPIFACDFYVQGIENGEELPGGYRLGAIVNVDHHAPTPRMVRPISSANLAIAHVRDAGPAADDAAIVLNHTDCDSVLSGAIVAGLLPADPMFGDAAIAADHTGDANEIADLLQSLEHPRDLDCSLRNLYLLLSGQPLEQPVAARVTARLRRREAAAELVHRGSFTRIGAVDLALPPEHMEGEFFAPLMPTAVVIMLATPMEQDPSRWRIKLRLGQAAPAGLTLHRLLAGLDSGYGGRWNAGSNHRGGGTALEPEVYARRLARRVDELVAGGG
ncbi:MAG TPA: hypothetical protein VFG66_04590 [Gemmatimonadales bacterium]|nr:hypothetical protein [Gemmatimonadales bacterium]